MAEAWGLARDRTAISGLEPGAAEGQQLTLGEAPETLLMCPSLFEPLNIYVVHKSQQSFCFCHSVASQQQTL